jgi:hypothetical protein
MLNMKWTLSAGLLAAALAVTAPQAGAQSPTYRGSFTLPFEARFGNVVLEPGKYSVSTLDGAKGLRITGDTKTVSILSAGYDIKPETANGKLVLVDVNGMYALQTFESGSLGKTLHFVVGKSRGNVESATVKQTVEVGLQ